MFVHMLYRAWNLYIQTATIMRSAMQRLDLSHTCDPRSDKKLFRHQDLAILKSGCRGRLLSYSEANGILPVPLGQGDMQ